MAAQTNRDWTWVVLLDPRDELLNERRRVFEETAPNFQPLYWRAPDKGRDDVAFDAYRAPWGEAMERDEVTLQTRLDDDDGLHPWAIAQYRREARLFDLYRGKKLILMMPRGIRVWDGKYATVRHRSNAMHTLVTSPGQSLTVYDYGHTKARRAAPVRNMHGILGWLWVRHRDTLSGWHSADRPISPRVRSWFPIDWDGLEAVWS